MKYIMPSSCQIANLSELYEKYFKDVTGIFIDVGAHDGYTFSNTYGLAEAGWSGICFEPMPNLYEKCRDLHLSKGHSVLTINTCIGASEGMIKLFTDVNPTIDLETVELSPWGSTYNKDNFIISPVTTLNKMLDKHIPEFLTFENFEVLSIDVEGAELHVLNGFDILKWLPKMVIVETHEGNSDTRKSFHSDAINLYFKDLPYVKIKADGLNTIWIHKSMT